MRSEAGRVPRRTGLLIGVFVALGTALTLSGCAGNLSDSESSSTPAPSPLSTEQLQVFVDTLPVALHILIADSLPEGAVIDPGEFASQTQWEALVRDGQSLCTDARASGWTAARQAARDRVRSGSGGSSTWDPALDPHLDLMVRAEVTAVTATGSFCPDLADPANG